MDAWDGYRVARDRIMAFLAQMRPSNPIVLTGDVHSSWVADLKADFNNPASQTVGTEFVGTSITSVFPTQALAPAQASLTDNPHIKFFNGARRGYVSFDVTPNVWRADFRGVTSVSEPDAAVETLASFAVENGKPGVVGA